MKFPTLKKWNSFFKEIMDILLISLLVLLLFFYINSSDSTLSGKIIESIIGLGLIVYFMIAINPPCSSDSEDASSKPQDNSPQ